MMRPATGPAPGPAAGRAPGPAQSAKPRLASAAWRALGCDVRLVVTDPGRLADARALVAAELDDVDAACSRFRPDSELRALRPGANQVSALLAEAIGVALRAADLTDGDVDPTIGAAMIAAGYDRDFAAIGARHQDDGGRTVTARSLANWREITLTGTRLDLPDGVQLDLGATAKAWAADRAAVFIAAALGTGALVSLGGDIAVAGPVPDGGWRVRVQDVTGDPAAEPDGPFAVVTLHNGGLATSSTKARRWRHGGDVLHHILDPRTGEPAAAVWRTVSVAASCAADANAASTAAIIRGRSAPGWLTALRLPARLVDASGAVFTVAGWPAHAEREPRQAEGGR